MGFCQISDPIRHTDRMPNTVVPHPVSKSRRTPIASESAGQRLTSAILADLEVNDLEPDAREVALLARAATAADRIEALEKIIAAEGETFVNKNGVRCPSPLLAECRLQDGILMAALRGLKLDPPTTPGGKNAAKSRAGKASWAARSARYGIGQIGRPLDGTAT